MATSPSVVAGEKWFPSGVTVKTASGVSAEAALPAQVLAGHLCAQVCRQLRQSSQLCKVQPRPQQGGSGLPWGPRRVWLAPPCSCVRHAGFPLECKSHGGRNLHIGLTAESPGPRCQVLSVQTVLSGSRKEWHRVDMCPGITLGPCGEHSGPVSSQCQLLLSTCVLTASHPALTPTWGDEKSCRPRGRKQAQSGAGALLFPGGADERLLCLLSTQSLTPLLALGGSCTRSPTTTAACTWWSAATSAASSTGRPTAPASSPSAGSSTASSRRAGEAGLGASPFRPTWDWGLGNKSHEGGQGSWPE